ncbi:MAG: hypothetical protein IKC04_03660, partial [Oscillospiraceae bacterium]|nr:hypothetical protein [Oscillospiraceae bacterium]
MNEEFNMYEQTSAEQESAPEQNAPQEKPKKKKKKVGGIIALVLVFAILGGVGGSYLTLQFEHLFDRTPVQDEPAAPVFEEVEMPKFKTVVGDKSLTPADVYAQNVDSVVGIV